MMTQPVIALVSGIGMTLVAVKLPNWWFMFPVRWILFLAGLVLVGNALFIWFVDIEAVSLGSVPR